MINNVFYSLLFCLVFNNVNAQDLNHIFKDYEDFVQKEKYALANAKLDSLISMPNVDESLQLALLLKKASLYSLLKAQDSALYYLEKTIVKAKLKNNIDLLNRASTNLGMLLNQIGRPKEALSHFKKHHQFVQNLTPAKPNNVRIIISKYNLGLTFFKLNEIDSARNYLNAGLQLAISENNYFGITKINGLLSQLNYSQGKNWKDNLSLAYQAASKAKDTVGLLKAHLTRAEFNESCGNIKEALKDLKKAELIINQNPENISLWLKFHKLKYKTFKSNSDYLNSLEELESYLNLKEKLDSLNQANAINIFNERIKINEKDLENSKLLVVQKQKINDLTLLSALLAFVVFIILGFLFFKSKVTSFHRKLFKINRLNEVNTDINDSKISEQNKILYHKIHEKIKKEKLFLDHDINLTSLAKLVNSNSNYVSEAINLYTKSNFNTYINKYRINHSKELITSLHSQNKLDFDYISEMSGFNSKTHFYRVFKQITGLTPKQYLSFVQESDLNIEV